MAAPDVKSQIGCCNGACCLLACLTYPTAVQSMGRSEHWSLMYVNKYNHMLSCH